MTLLLKCLWKKVSQKKDEADADQKALEMLISTGYDPQSYINYLSSLKPHLEQGQAKVLSKTHPTIDTRIKLLSEFISRYQLDSTQGKKNEKRFKHFMVSL